MFKIISLSLLCLCFCLSEAAAAQQESQKKWAVYSRGLKVGLGIGQAQGSQTADYTPGIAFHTGVFSSFGWHGLIQLQPEINFTASQVTVRDELLLGTIPTGLFRNTSLELSEVQFGGLLKLGRPSWAEAKLGEKGRRSRNHRQLRQRRWLPYLAAGAMASRTIESKRIIQLDSPGAIAKSDPWLASGHLVLEWVSALGYEYTRASGGGVGIELRWQTRDLPVKTGLGDSVKLSAYTLNVLLLF